MTFAGAPAASPPARTSPTSPPPIVYTGLLGFAWNGVGIPYTRMRMVLRQDLVIHKFVDADGAYVEGTGRAPLQFEATCPFINTIAAGSNETWTQPLYPTNWRAFINACLKGDTGILQHPELGDVTCKLEEVATEWEGESQGGPIVHAKWIETDDSTVNAALINQALGQPSPISAAQAACATLDQNLGDINPAVTPALPPALATFTSLFQAVAAISTQAQLLSYEAGGQLQAIVTQAQLTENEINATPNALNWPIIQAAEQAKDACFTLQGQLLTTGAQVASYTTLAEMTIAAIAATLSTSLAFLLNLNPGLAINPVVPAGTVVRYYAAPAAA